MDKDYLNGIVCTEDNVYFRENKNLGVDNMATMFIKVTQALTGDNYFIGRWCVAKGYPQEEEDEDFKLCICNHVIKKVYYIQHKRTGIIAAVGSDCVEKVDEGLYKKITKDLCDVCEDEPLDKRTREGREGKCSKCYLFWYYGKKKCSLKKHMGKRYSEIIKEDPNYCIWVVNTLKKLDPKIREFIKKSLNLVKNPHTKIWS